MTNRNMSEEAELGTTIRRLMGQEFERGYKAGREEPNGPDYPLHNAMARAIRSEESSPKFSPDHPAHDTRCTATYCAGTDQQLIAHGLAPKLWGNTRATGAVWVGDQPPTPEQVDAADPKQALNVWDVVTDLQNKVQRLEQVRATTHVFSSTGLSIDAIEAAVRAMETREVEATKQIRALSNGLDNSMKRTAQLEHTVSTAVDGLAKRLTKLEHDHLVHTECINGQAEHLRQLDAKIATRDVLLRKLETRPEDYRGRFMGNEHDIGELKIWRSNVEQRLSELDCACTKAHEDTIHNVIERLEKLEQHPERLGSSEKHADMRIEGLVGRVKDLEDRYNRACPMRGA